ncbi:hypothetical protein D3C72_1798750 [compost metagenome]
MGIAAPRPIPVMKRITVRLCRSAAKPESSVNRPSTSTEPVSTFLRPRRSASGPAISAPAARPNSAALSTGASAGLLTPHSWISDGAI